jgi:hypothetical protein
MLALGALVTALGTFGPQAFPAAAGAWRPAGPPARYDAETIFGYIDGHGEVYLAYGMVACLAQRYSGPQGEGDIVADVFEMPTAADAFGVFSHTREGEPADVGQGASFGYGTLAFWQGRHFVSITAEQDSPRAREGVLGLGRSITSALGPPQAPPSLLGRLPDGGLDARSTVYLRHPHILNAHLALGPDNLLGLGPGATAVIGRYRRGPAIASLVLVEYATAAESAAAREVFSARFLEKARPTQRPDGVYATVELAGSMRGFVIRASTRELAEALLAEAARKGGQP